MLSSVTPALALLTLLTAAASEQAESLPAVVPPAARQPDPEASGDRLVASSTPRLPMALGLELGEASGVHIAYPLDARQQVSGLIGYSPLMSSLTLRSDYTYRFFKVVPDEDYGVHLAFFGGAGLRLGLFEPRPTYLREVPLALGARLPLGVAASLPPLPAELLLTVAPGGDVLPKLRFRLEASLTLRFQIDLMSGKPWSSTPH